MYKRLLSLLCFTMLSALYTTVSADVEKYGITVGGVEVTSENRESVTGGYIKSGTVRYIPLYNTLELVDAVIECEGTGTEAMLKSTCPGLRIRIGGACTISNGGFAGIEIMGGVTNSLTDEDFLHAHYLESTLTVSGRYYGIYIGSDSQLNCTSSQITAKGQTGIGSNNKGERNETLKVNAYHSIRAISTSPYYAAINSLQNVELGEGIVIMNPEDAVLRNVQDKGICSLNSDGTLCRDITLGMKDYGITVGGVSVTSRNANNITGKNILEGKVTYNAEKRELTLNNAVIGTTSTMETAIINDSIDGLSISLVGNNKICAAKGYSGLELYKNTSIVYYESFSDALKDLDDIAYTLEIEGGRGIYLGLNVELSMYGKRLGVTINAQSEGITSGYADGNGTKLWLNKVGELKVTSETKQAIGNITGCEMQDCDVVTNYTWFSPKRLSFAVTDYNSGSVEKAKEVVVKPVSEYYDIYVAGNQLNNVSTFVATDEMEQGVGTSIWVKDSNGNPLAYELYVRGQDIQLSEAPFIDSGIPIIYVHFTGAVSTKQSAVVLRNNGWALFGARDKGVYDYDLIIDSTDGYAIEQREFVPTPAQATPYSDETPEVEFDKGSDVTLRGGVKIQKLTAHNLHLTNGSFEFTDSVEGQGTDPQLTISGDTKVTFGKGQLINYKELRLRKGISVLEPAGAVYDPERNAFVLNGKVVNTDVVIGRLKGDANGDGVVDVADVATVIDVMAGNNTQHPTPNTYNSADVNSDGSIDVADIAAIIDIMAGN